MAAVNDFKCNNQPKTGGRDGEENGGEVLLYLTQERGKY